MAISKKLIERLYVAYNVFVLTGSGVSAPSGVPTFRGKDGLWNKYKPQELANLHAFLSNPELVWEWYSWRRELIRKVKPNTAHYALVDLEKCFDEFSLVTQNVDNLHRIAGTQNIIELHGNIMRNKCIDCAEGFTEEQVGRLKPQPGEKVPRCPSCGSFIRPDVVWFGEMLPEAEINYAQQAAAGSEVFFSIGTSSTVEPAASLAYLAKGNGAYLVEINTEETPLTAIANESIQADVCDVLPKISMIMQKLRKRG